MINEDNLGFLRKKTKTKDFHISRRMFCIRDGRVEVAPLNVKDSHIEWFEKEGWVDKENVHDFLRKNIRGFYLPNENKIYCYKGVGFYFDNKVLSKFLDNIVKLKKALNLNNDTEVHLGPKDNFVDGKEYQSVFAGTLKGLMNKK